MNEAGRISFVADTATVGSEETIATHFQRQAALTPLLPAVVTADVSLNYAELEDLARSIAHGLAGLPHPERPVGLLMREGPLLIATILAVSMANRIFIPLEITGAEAWLARVIASSGTAYVVTEEAMSALAARVAGENAGVVIAENIASTSGELPTYSERNKTAFIIYTSGSMGEAKGVALGHAFLLHRIAARSERYNFSAGERYGHVRSCGYSAALNTALAALLSGVGVYVFDLRGEGLHRMTPWLNAKGITQLALTGSLFRTWLAALPVKYVLPNLRAVSAAAEPLYGSDLTRMATHLVGDWRLLHTFSSTETGVVTTAAFGPESSVTQGALPVGKPIKGVEVRLEDEDGHAVPDGEAGEIVVYSDHMADGYWNNPALTASSFGQDSRGRCVYRTRDFGRFRADGMLEHLGRKDRKIKLRGYSVEPHEVECALLRLSNVRDAAVIVEGTGDDARLLAFVSGPTDFSSASGQALRNDLMRDLPPQLVPAEIVPLPALPLTPRGKIDRVALAGRRRPKSATPSQSPPADEYEGLLFEIWRKSLRRRDFGIDDNFYDLGGTSLEGFLIVSWLDTLGWDMPPSILREAPTIAQQAAILRSRSPSLVSRKLVPFREGGDGAPLFFLHARKGDILYVRELLPYIAQGRPIYGLRPSPLDGTSRLLRSVEDIASDAILEMRAVRPHGPFLLCGYSFGGTVAIEVARQLTEQGDIVGFVGLIDTLMGQEARYRRRAKAMPKSLRRLYATFWGMGVAISYWPDEIRAALRLPVPYERRMAYYSFVYSRASRRYLRRPYFGPIVMFSSHQRAQQHRTQWAPIAQGGMDIYEIHAHHRDIVWPPACATLASYLDEALAAVKV